MNRPNFNNPDDTLSGVLILAITAVTCGWVLLGMPT